jgi:DNA-binding response OmpR family regulator
VRSILLIDDSAIQLGIRKTVLENAGFRVLTALSAEAAFAVLSSHNADRPNIGAIVTDHLMPDVPGSQFVRQLRALNPDIPVIVISGLPEAIEEYVGLNVHFRYKPCQPGELIELLRLVTRDKHFSAAV